MKILGLDASLSSTGYSIFEDEELKGYGLIKTKKTDENRFFKIYSEIKHIIKENNIKCIIMEDGYIGMNRQHSMEITKVRGIIQLIGEMENITTFVLSPMSIKKYIAGKGNAKKEDVYNTLCRIFENNLIFNSIGPYSDIERKNIKKTSDIYDAISIALCYRYINVTNI